MNVIGHFQAKQITPNFVTQLFQIDKAFISSGTGLNKEEQLKKENPFDFFVFKLQAFLALGINDLNNSAFERDFNGRIKSNSERVSEAVLGTLKLATLGRAGALGKLKDFGGWEVGDFVGEKMMQWVVKELGWDRDEAANMVCFFLKVGFSKKDSDAVQNAIGVLFKIVEGGAKGTKAVNEFFQRTGFDVRMPKDAKAAAKKEAEKLLNETFGSENHSGNLKIED